MEEKVTNKPAVIFAHGLRSSKDSPRNIYIAGGLVEKGFCCFLPDFTGHGESEGDASDATVEQFARDIGVSLDYINSKEGVNPARVGICGSSIGGTAALVRAATDSRIKALALRSAPAEGYYKYADNVRIPTLIVQGDADPIMSESLILHEHLAGEKKLALIKGADHLYSKEKHLREAREAIVQWFVEKLGSDDPAKIYKDRKDAGAELAYRLKDYKDRKDVMVLALPRGGAVTGYKIASYLNCPLDVIIVRKLGFPGQPELAIGAVSETGTVVLNESIITSYGVTEDYIRDEISRQKKVIEKRVDLYRKGQKIPDLKGKIIILVDDGAATGATAKAAVSTLKLESIEKLVVALPVAPPDTADELRRMADEFICLETPYDFTAVGSYYEDFTQVTDEEVVDILERARKSVKALTEG
ncbi:alpha/beta fold hydrolase [Candidatus Methanoperedens nitratireducens]|uniref:Phosphoribosyltransferase (Modular protein) n=1 Tax=Candidatus Methanoperedens nitratireducens TaxID=1392998 RepID=A0A284VJA2_9EURY|nr:alpha/beta fold hydrolase [Candidatus Methanoperedens nitroreducens]SNQ59331.1 Phosphoribosyltransferase (modular protein) [Candidatus Methanoperedens nitroreducens]